MLYRGLADARWKVEASLYRRLRKKGMSDSKARSVFIHASEYLVEQAKQHGHARDYARSSVGELKPLQVMAQLQHYGASTCLIDFTRNPLVALWFACGQPKKEGKVVAIKSDDLDKYKIIQSTHLHDFSLGDLLKKDHLWKWQPEKLNNRIVAQHSEFIFGEPVIDAPDAEFAVPIAAKDEIMQALKEYNISEEHLLADFYGFAQLNAHSRPYDYAPLAVKAAGEGDNQRAIHLYDIAIKKEKDNPTLLNNRGSVKAAANNLQGAIADFNAAIKLNKKYAKAYSNRGDVKYELGKYKRAIDDYDKAIECNSRYADAYNNRGLVKDELGEYKCAIADYNKAIKYNSWYADAYNNRGITKVKLGKYKRAIADYNKAIECNPQDAAAYNNRGIARRILGDLSGAIADHSRAIEINPQDADAYNNRGITKGQSDVLSGAIADFDKAIELNLRYASAYRNRGIAKRRWLYKEGPKAPYSHASASTDFWKARELEKAPNKPKKK